MSAEVLARETREWRTRRGLTQEDVAEKRGGPSVGSLRTIENGQAERYSGKTLRSLDLALQWVDGTASRLLAGEIEKAEEAESLPESPLSAVDVRELDHWKTRALEAEAKLRAIAALSVSVSEEKR